MPEKNRRSLCESFPASRTGVPLRFLLLRFLRLRPLLLHLHFLRLYFSLL